MAITTTVLDTVYDRSGIIIEVEILDHTGQPVSIISGTWTLLDDKSAVINNKEREPLPSPINDKYYIGLTGEDTAYAAGPSRTLVVEATYNNSLTGTVMDVNSFSTFTIKDIPFVT